MATQRTSRAFKDISLSFSPHPVTKDLPVLTNERAVVRSVRNLVETIPTERFFNSLIGTDIRGSLFENFSRETLVTIEDQIRDTINNFVPRVDNLVPARGARPIPTSPASEIVEAFIVISSTVRVVRVPKLVILG